MEMLPYWYKRKGGTRNQESGPKTLRLQEGSEVDETYFRETIEKKIPRPTPRKRREAKGRNLIRPFDEGRSGQLHHADVGGHRGTM